MNVKTKTVFGLIGILLILGCTTTQVEDNETSVANGGSEETISESEQVQVTRELPEEIPVYPNSTLTKFSEYEDSFFCLFDEYKAWSYLDLCNEESEDYVGREQLYTYEYDQSANESSICDFYENAFESEDVYKGVTFEYCGQISDSIIIYGAVVDDAGNPEYYFQIMRSTSTGESAYLIELYDLTSN